MQRGYRPGFWYRKGYGENGRVPDDYSGHSRWDTARVSLDESCERLDAIGGEVFAYFSEYPGDALSTPYRRPIHCQPTPMFDSTERHGVD